METRFYRLETRFSRLKRDLEIVARSRSRNLERAMKRDRAKLEICKTSARSRSRNLERATKRDRAKLEPF